MRAGRIAVGIAAAASLTALSLWAIMHATGLQPGLRMLLAMSWGLVAPFAVAASLTPPTQALRRRRARAGIADIPGLIDFLAMTWAVFAVLTPLILLFVAAAAVLTLLALAFSVSHWLGAALAGTVGWLLTMLARRRSHPYDPARPRPRARSGGGWPPGSPPRPPALG